METKPNKLGKCPECGNLVVIADIVMIGDDEVVGCGLAEDDFMTCDTCLYNLNDNGCECIRTNYNLSQTTAEEYCTK